LCGGGLKGMSIFHYAEALKCPWIGCSDIPLTELVIWNQKFASSEIKVTTDRLIYRIAEHECEEMLSHQSAFISIVKEELKLLSLSIPLTHFFVVTNEEGIVLHLEGEDQVIQNLEKVNISPGSSFAWEYSGLNGISLSMKTGALVVVEDTEHTLQMFAGWTCVCLPIKLKNKTLGYLDISMKCGIDVSFAAVLLGRAAHAISTGINKLCPEIKKAHIYKLLEQYQLTPREKEVGYGWLHNQSTLQMSMSMGITEGTVRNMLKKVYYKTGVCDKGQYFRKFLV
jgi:transcriptional regulator of acetoin/glycerol metabolism